MIIHYLFKLSVEKVTLFIIYLNNDVGQHPLFIIYLNNPLKK